MPDLVALHRRSASRFTVLVGAIGDDEWALPTPCADWDVRALVNHVTGENLWVGPLLGGSTVDEVGDRFEGDVLGAHPARAFDRSMDEALAAVEAPDALDRTVHLSRGPTPAEQYVFERFLDLLIHGWDLARAIGADDRLDPESVDVCHERLGPLMPLWKQTGLFGSHVEPPPGADLQTRLLAMLGRRS